MKTVVISGGTSGIGKRLVKLFLNENMKVITFSSKKKNSVKWGERVRDPNAMNLITIDDVKAKIKEIIKK